MQKDRKRQLIGQYKERKAMGGVYAIRNTVSGKAFVECTADMPGSRNRFAFAMSNGSGLPLKLQKDWDALGKEHFCFEVLEELEMQDGQSMDDFQRDIRLLRDMWLEKLGEAALY